uniref:Craniofacial development protein 2 n=1 Tax=Cacopsylla melanoneura TaxID=428564 RepID=A0A8D8SWI4_9HEMI
MDLVALQEVRWPHNGKESTENYQIYYSGNTEGKYQKGVGFAVKRQIDSAVTSFEAVNERICIIRLKGRFKNISVICMYAPIEDAESEDKDEFYEELEEIWNRLPNYDVKILMGDANAKVGREMTWRNIAGKESLHEYTNDNGTRLLSLAVAGDLRVASTTFPRKNIHKETWNSPNGITKNQIDHVLIDNRHKKNIINVRSIRGAECGSDHNLVLIKIKQSLATEKKNNSNQLPNINLENIKDPIKASRYRELLSTKFEQNAEAEEMDLERKWSRLKNTIQDCARDICGEKEKRRRTNPWFDRECSEEVERRKTMRQKWLETNHDEDRRVYNNQNKATVKLLRQKKRRWLNGLITRAEEDRTRNNSRDFYRTLRFFSKEYKPKAYGVKDKDGHLIMQQKEGLERWKEYFEGLLNGEVRESQEPTIN